MTDNLNINDIGFGDSFKSALCEGNYSNLFKRIDSVVINELHIKNAFERFVKETECDNTISVAEILYAAEAVISKNKINENAGNKVYCYKESNLPNKKLLLKLQKFSVRGIFNLFTLRNGITLDMSMIGDNIAACETKRFVVLPEKKGLKLIEKAKKNGLQLTQVGEMLANYRIVLTCGTQIISDIDKNDIVSTSNTISVRLGKEHLDAYISVYNSVCAYGLCGCVTDNNLVRFGLDCDLDTAVAKALGFFAACMFLKNASVQTVFTNEKNDVLSVPRPNISDGDYLYLLKLRVVDKMPEAGHFGQLYYYLSEKKKMGIIKDVLPVRENINGMIYRLCENKLDYVSLATISTDCFGIIVTVPRGESVNGIKLGYFKDI